MRGYPRLADRCSVLLSPAEPGQCDAVLICTHHDYVEHGAAVAATRLVIDTRNATCGGRSGGA